MPDETDETRQEQLVFFPPVVVTPRHLAAQRVDPMALGHLQQAYCQEVVNFLEASGWPPCHVLLSCAVLPEHRRMFEFQSHPAEIPEESRRGLIERLTPLDVPPVRQGPVAFYICFALYGGAPGGAFEFSFPFSSLFPRGTSCLDEILMTAVGMAPQEYSGPPVQWEPQAGTSSPRESLKPGRLRRLWDWILGRRRVLLYPRGVSMEPLPEWNPSDSTVPSDILHHVGSPEEYTVDDLTELIAQYPSFSRFYRLRADHRRLEEKFDEAIEDYSRYLELKPGDVGIQALRGATYCLAGRLEPGLVDLNRALSVDPRCVSGLQARAGVYRELGALDQAEQDLSKAIEEMPLMPTLPLLRGELRFSRDDKERALEDVTEALRLDPHDEAAYSLRARVRQSLLKPDEKEGELSRALLADLDHATRLNPGNPEHPANRAAYYLQRMELDRALEECDRALAADPGYAHALGLRALAWEAKGDIDNALRDATTAIDQGADRPEFILCRARALASQGEVDAALEIVENVLGNDADIAFAHDTRGRLRLELGDIDGAIEDFNEALRLDPGMADSQVGRALARHARKDFGGAIQDLDEALKLDPSLSAAHYHLAGALAEDGRLGDALKNLDECIRLSPQSAAAYFLRATIRLRTADTDKALEDLNTVVGLDSDFIPAYFTRGNLLLNEDELDAALRDFDRVIELCPTMPAAHGSRGSVWIYKGDLEKGAGEYQEAIRLEPESAERFMIQRLIVESIYHRQEEHLDESVARAGEAIELDSDCWPAFMERATSFWYSERLDEALADLERVAELAGESFVVLSVRGQVLAESGQFESAIADLDTALEQAKSLREPEASAYPLSGRGLARAGMERYEEAAQDFEESLRLCPENAWAHFNQALMHHKRGESQAAIGSLRQALSATHPRLPPGKRHRAELLLQDLCREDPGAGGG